MTFTFQVMINIRAMNEDDARRKLTYALNYERYFNKLDYTIGRCINSPEGPMVSKPHEATGK